MKALKFIIFYLLISFCSHSAWAGAEGHGGNHIKTRILWAREISKKILQSNVCKEHFKESACGKMYEKLNKAILVWRMETDEPLTVFFNGVTQEVTARTTEHIEGQIEIDLGRAQDMNLLELTVLILHEAGHVVGLSDDLITDRKVIAIMLSDERLVAVAEILENKRNPPTELSSKKLSDWARSSSSILKNQLALARRQSSSQGEIEVLMAGIETVQRISPPEYFPILIPTLFSAQGDASRIQDPLYRSHLLRKYYSFAFADLERLSRINVDTRDWLTDILKRSFRLAFNAGSPTEEIFILSRTLERSIMALNISPLSSEIENQCISNSLSQVLDTELQLSSEQVKLDYLRPAIRSLMANIARGSCRVD